MQDLKAQVLELAQILDFQPGSVVSRELLSLKTGTLTVVVVIRNELSSRIFLVSFTIFISSSV